MNRRVKISHFLSYHLRHRPDLLNLELAPGGWVAVDLLIKAETMSQTGYTLLLC